MKEKHGLALLNNNRNKSSGCNQKKSALLPAMKGKQRESYRGFAG